MLLAAARAVSAKSENTIFRCKWYEQRFLSNIIRNILAGKLFTLILSYLYKPY